MLLFYTFFTFEVWNYQQIRKVKEKTCYFVIRV
nr:MAG TPA: hypothetical protein [Bacteriophage sp.]